MWCVGVGRHAVGLWENRPARLLGVWLLSLSTAMDCCSLCWGWWFGCVVVVCFVNSGREHLAITLCVVVVILFVFVFLVLFVLSP